MQPIFRRSQERTFPVPPKVERGLEWSRPKRYLVVGSEGHGRGVTSYGWDRLPDELNVADYDVAVFNYAAFDDNRLAEGFPPDRLPTVESMTRLLFSPKAEIIAIGNPSTLIGSLEQSTTRLYDPRVRCDSWLPFHIGTEDNLGTQYRVDAEEWGFYFEHLSGWRWIATGAAVPRPDLVIGGYLRPVTDQAQDTSVLLEPIATTRYEKMIALRAHVYAIRYTRALPGFAGTVEVDPNSRQIVLEASPLFWLPAPDRVTVEEGIDIILRERYGIAQEARVPDWAGSYRLPAEAPIAAGIAELEQERRELEQRISGARAQAVEVSRPRALLYEKGKDVLEPIVRATLRALGAEVEDPEAEGIEDGKLRRDEGQAILEIKGRNGPIKQDDVRQVVQWASDAKLRDGVEYKPLILGNPHCDSPPGKRGEVLAPNGATYARNGGVAVVTTVQLFEALRQQQSGTFDEVHFWKTVFETSGAADLAGPIPDESVRASDA